MHHSLYGTKQPAGWNFFRRRWTRTTAIVGVFFLASFLLTRHDRVLRNSPFFRYPQEIATASPDGRFRIAVDTKEESDLQVRYAIKLTDNVTHEVMEIVNCVRRDLPAPNFYWDKYSKYLVVDQCAESFHDSRILIFNLRTKRTEHELTGLTGNKDPHGQQFDQDNSVLLYFDTSVYRGDGVPDLYAFDLNTKKNKKLLAFETTMDFEFPAIKRKKGERMIEVSYNDAATRKRINKEIAY